MAACTSDTTSGSDEQDAFKRSSLCRCPNKQYTVPFWLKVKQLFIGKELKKNTNKSDEIKKVRKTKEKFSSSNVSTGRICGIIVLVALFCCSSAACIVMWFTDIYLRQILETMTVHNGSFMFESWRKPSLKPLICVYAFNYTNLDRYLASEEDRIRVQETGPYCYRETLEKINVKFNEEEGTVTYGNKRSHKFDESHSRGNPNDTLVLPNLGVITAISQVRKKSIFKQVGLTVMLRASDAKVITRVKAHDFFFDYKDTFLKTVTKLQKILQEEDTRYKKFGILAIRGAETDDTLTVKTGENDLEHIDVVTAVNGQRKLNIWYGEECNRIDGSDGAFFPRKDINRTTTLYLFHQDICRRLPLVYDRDVDFQDGIMAMRFHMPPSVYDINGTCYCKNNCPPKGIFDLSRCSKGIPIMMSFPHFLNGDPSLTEHIEGLHPNKSLHDFFIDVQPSLGFSLGMVSRLQVNIQVKKSPAIPYLHGFKDDIILPIVWIEVFADRLPQDLFRVIYHATFTVRNAQLCLMWGTLIATVVTALCILHSLWKIPGRDKHKLPPLPSQSTQMVYMHPQTQQITQTSNSTVPSTSICDTNV